MHMVRNAVDHGIESSARRAAAGKRATGKVTLAAAQSGGRILIEVRDDGGGLDHARIVAKAVERGLVAEGTALSERDAFNLIFAPGFSTAEVVTDVSGRGVGMDVVKTNIERMKGTIDVRSERGVGSVFGFSLPLTTSITDGILVVVRGRRLVIPMDGVRDLVPLTSRIPYGHGGGLVEVRGQLLPLVELSGIFGAKQAAAERGMAVVVESAGKRHALVVDAVVEQMQVVLKPLGSVLKQVRGVAGAAIRGDGRVALVLDLASLVGSEQRRAA
jgi:two-component system chemotaxis sensor kinase CheA